MVEGSGFELATPYRAFSSKNCRRSWPLICERLKQHCWREHCRHAFALNRFSPFVMMFGDAAREIVIFSAFSRARDGSSVTSIA